MGGKLALAALLLAVAAVVAAGCSGGNAEGTQTGPVATSAEGTTGGQSERIRPTWIGSDVLSVDGDSLLIPVDEVTSGRMLHFSISTTEYGKENFMVYDLDGETYVRANVCPPCRSVGFSLVGDTLVCENCGTVFSAKTGDGISGACRDFPKAEAQYAISGDNISVGINDLVAAFQNTEKPGWP